MQQTNFTKMPADEINALALRLFYERDENPTAPKMTPAELASFNADVRRIMAMLDQLNSPDDKIAAYLGVQNSVKSIDGTVGASRPVTPLVAASSAKKANTSTPSTLSPTHAWALRRFS